MTKRHPFSIQSAPLAGRAALVLALSSITLVGHAAEPTPRPSAAVAPSPAARAARAPTRAASSLSQLALDLANSYELAEAPLVVVGPLDTRAFQALDAAALRALHARFREIVGAAIAPVAARSDEPLDPTQARREARRRGVPLVYLAPTLRGGEVLLSVDIVAWPRTLWQKARAPHGTLLQQFTLRAPVDAEIRRFVPPLPGLFSERGAVATPVRDVVALACGELEDARTSLFVVGRRDVALGHFERARFVTTRVRPWSELSPLSATPLREPLLRAVYGTSTIDLGSSDRAEALRLDQRLDIVGRSRRMLPLDGTSCAAFSTTGREPTSSTCRFALGAPERSPTPVETADSLVHDLRRSIALADGTSIEVTLSQSARLEPGRLVVRSPLRSDVTLLLPELGSVAEIADLDGDGAFELISSGPSALGEPDRLRVDRFDGARLEKRAEFPVDSIRALTVCPFRGESPLPIVAATDEQLLYFR